MSTMKWSKAPRGHRRGRLLGSAIIAFALALVGALVVPLGVHPAWAQADTLRVGASGLPPGRGNPYKGVGHPHIYTWAGIFDALTVVNPTGAPTPGLATSWKNIDPNTWRIELRRGVTFQNGEPFNAEAVAVTIGYVTTDEGLATAAGRNFRGYSVTAIDDYTIELKTEKPNPIVPNVLAALRIMAPKAWTDLGDEGFTQTPFGTGPFRLVEWAGERAILKAFMGSWRPPKIGNLEVVELPERAARRDALLSGQIDIMNRPSVDDIPQLEAAGFTVHSIAGPLSHNVALLQEGPTVLSAFTDKRVRQALNYAVNKEAMGRELFRNTRATSAQPATSNAFGFDPNLEPYPYDPDKARALLAEAGYADGFSFVLEFSGDEVSMYQQIAQDLGAVGVEVDIRTTTFPDWLKKFLGNTWEGNAFSHVWGVAPEIDAAKPMGFNSCMKSNPWYCNQTVMPLIEKISNEFDADKRKLLLHELMRWYHDEAPSIYLFDQPEMNAFSPRVQNFNNINRALQYHEMTLAE
jgi:peptide/nickel transport system substrate-binding protein